MSDTVNFVCLKWGKKYSASYVNKLYRMVKRNFHSPFHFYCLTEDESGLDAGVRHLQLERSDLQGFWYKLALFQRDFYGIRGDLIYLDLDVVIVGDIDFLSDYPGRFVIARNWSRNPMWNSSVMRFRIGEYAFVWERFLENKTAILERCNGDQEWIYECVPNAATWPAERVVSYKKSLNSRAFPLFWKLGLKQLVAKAADRMDTSLPPEASIVVFHGEPNPGDVAEHGHGYWKRASFVAKHWC